MVAVRSLDISVPLELAIGVRAGPRPASGLCIGAHFEFARSVVGAASGVKLVARWRHDARIAPLPGRMLAEVPADQAFRPLKDGGCPLVK
jgi:hypothetical protein